MYAGTLTQIDPRDEPLEAHTDDGRAPALSVDSQATLDDSKAVQFGTVAGYHSENAPDVFVTEGADGVSISSEPNQTRRLSTTDYVAEVCETGLIIPASIAGDGALDFPLDVLASAAGEIPERLVVDVDELKRTWQDDGTLLGTPMQAGTEGTRTDISYGGDAIGQAANIGLGFERDYHGTVIEGVVYATGYLACYNAGSPTEFVGFVEEAILPHASVPSEEDAQQTLTGGECEGCGRDVDELTDGLCIVCDDARDEGVSA